MSVKKSAKKVVSKGAFKGLPKTGENMKQMVLAPANESGLKNTKGIPRTAEEALRKSKAISKLKKSGCVITLLNHQIEKDVQVSLGKEFSDTSKIMESATVKKLKKAGKVISPPMPEKTPNRFGELNALVALNDPLEMVFHNMDSEDSEERVAESLSYAVEKLNKIFINFTEQLSEVNRLFQAHESLRGKVQTLLKDVPPNNNTLDVRLP